MAQSLTGVLRTLLLYIALDILLLQPRSAIGTAGYYLRYLRFYSSSTVPYLRQVPYRR